MPLAESNMLMLQAPISLEDLFFWRGWVEGQQGEFNQKLHWCIKVQPHEVNRVTKICVNTNLDTSQTPTGSPDGKKK